MNIKFNPTKNLEGSGSREAKTIEKFNEYIAANSVEINSEEQIREIIGNRKTRVSMPGVDVEAVIELMKKKGMIDKVKEEKKKIKEEDIPITKTETEKAAGLKVVDNPELARIFKENQEFQELQKSVFENPEEIDSIFNKSLLLRKERVIESEKYYQEFAPLVSGGMATVKEDWKNLNDIQKSIEEEDKEIHQEQQYKVAMIVERSVAYGAELGWFGGRVSIEPTCKFDDIKRGVDGMLEIKDPEEESRFLALGIDVTISGLESFNYKNKFFKVLESIKRGRDTRVKYFKNHAGEMMKEFSVPKIILSFDAKGVKSLVNMIRSSDNQKIREEFKTSAQKFVVMNQVIAQCRVFADFAREYGNPIAEKYDEVRMLFENIAETVVLGNSDVEKKIHREQQNKLISRMQSVVEEWKEAEELEMAA